MAAKGRKMKIKFKRSYTLTDDADTLLEMMAIKNGISKSAILEIAIRNEAKKQEVTIDKKTST